MRRVVWKPNSGPQTEFLSSTVREVLYGGAAGGGKSDALMVLPVRWFTNPRFRGIILRRTRPQLQELIDRTKELYPEIGVPLSCWTEQRGRWELPAGGILRMGYAEYEQDILNFKSDQYSYIAFDELTSFTQKQYLFMWSRNRAPKGCGIPLLMRAATNPGDIGHKWVFERFIEKRHPYRVYDVEVDVRGYGTIRSQRQFIPASVFDNPMLEDRDQYIAGLQLMGPDLAEALLYGKWDQFEGQFFKQLPEQVPAKLADSDYYVIRCMDYGFIDPSAVYWLVVYRKLRMIDIVGEVYVTEVTIEDLAKLIHAREQQLRNTLGIQRAPSISVADPNMFNKQPGGQQSVGDMLSRRGVWFEQANNDRAAGWAMLRLLLHAGRLRVWQGQAPMLMKSLPTLQYHPDKKDDIKKGGEDHGADALRYGTVAFFEAAPPPVAEAAPDPRIQDTGLEKLLEALGKQGQRDPLLEYAAGLLD